MSFRELRNFCEIMRSLGYNRIISMENFRQPNFMLVAEIIVWLINRFDPKAEISDNIDEDSDRVDFIRSAAQFFNTNLKIKVNLKKLYGADGYCVQELLKIAEVLYKAQKSVLTRDEYEYTNDLDITSRLQEIKQTKSLSNEIVESGLNLLDLLEKEKSLKIAREKSLEFLDNITRNMDSKKEQEIEKSIVNILQNQGSSLQNLEQELQNKKEEEKKYEDGIKQKTLELERIEKRLEQLLNVKPAHYQELKQMEQELAYVYRIYIEKLRNHDYLSHQLEIYHKLEEEANNKSKNELIDLQERQKIGKEKILRDENELLNGDDEDDFNDDKNQIQNHKGGVKDDDENEENEQEDEQAEESDDQF